MSEIKGSKLSSKLEFVRKVFGAEAVPKVIEALPRTERELMGTLIDGRWYPSEAYDHLVHAICRVVADGDESIYDRMGAHSAEHQLNNIYAAFRRDELLKTLRNMVPMHSHLNNPAHMEVQVPGPEECLIVVTAPKSSPVNCRISRAFYRRTAELSGAHGVEVSEPTCTARGDDACRFRLQWAH